MPIALVSSHISLEFYGQEEVNKVARGSSRNSSIMTRQSKNEAEGNEKVACDAPPALVLRKRAFLPVENVTRIT